MPAEPDPFEDDEFQDRLGKLLAMMGSSQEGEAEAARRKLVEHLAHRRLRPSDLAARLRRPPSYARPREPRPSGWTEGEASRELDLSRHARQAAEEMAQAALAENLMLRRRAAIAERDVQVLRVRRGVAHVIAAFAAALSLLLALVLASEHIDLILPHDEPRKVVTNPTVASQFGDAQESPHPSVRLRGTPPVSAVQPVMPGERLGYVVASSLGLHEEPIEQSPVRVILARGTPVVLVRDVVGERGTGEKGAAGDSTWSLIRSDGGAGYVLASAIGLPATTP